MNLQMQILEMLNRGLEIKSRPFSDIAQKLEITEQQVLSEIEELKAKGIIKRFGLVVKHHEVGYKFNAMVVWNIEDELCAKAAHIFLQRPFITLCYRRPRNGTEWPYNLFCMIHGQDRALVLQQVEVLKQDLTKNNISFNSEVLFSGKRFKQQGANYFSTLEEIDKKIINSFQDGLPFESQPFKKFAIDNHISEWEICYRIRRLIRDGYLSRFGPMFNIDKGGGQFILCALEVPENDFDRVAEIVNSFDEVAHNYKRDHKLNMWFVLGVEDKSFVPGIIDRISTLTGYKVYPFPKTKEFFVDLRFQV